MRIATGILAVILCYYFLSCTSGSSRIHKDDSMYADSLRKAKDSLEPKHPQLGNLVPDSDLFYAAFQLSPTIQAFVITGYYGQVATPADSLLGELGQDTFYFHQGYTDDPAYRNLVDSSGPAVISFSEMAQQKCSAFLDRQFFIYCTKGITRRKVNRVVFSVSNCQTSFLAFIFDPIDTTEFGHPLVASLKQDAELFQDSQIEGVFTHYNDSIVKTIRDYTDTIGPKIFARLDKTHFLVYYDDFRWPFVQEDRNCFFPGREILELKDDGSIESSWYDGLDLFGVPCD